MPSTEAKAAFFDGSALRAVICSPRRSWRRCVLPRRRGRGRHRSRSVPRCPCPWPWRAARVSPSARCPPSRSTPVNGSAPVLPGGLQEDLAPLLVRGAVGAGEHEDQGHRRHDRGGDHGHPGRGLPPRVVRALVAAPAPAAGSAGRSGRRSPTARRRGGSRPPGVGAGAAGKPRQRPERRPRDGRTTVGTTTVRCSRLHSRHQGPRAPRPAAQPQETRNTTSCRPAPRPPLALRPSVPLHTIVCGRPAHLASRRPRTPAGAGSAGPGAGGWPWPRQRYGAPRPGVRHAAIRGCRPKPAGPTAADPAPAPTPDRAPGRLSARLRRPRGPPGSARARPCRQRQQHPRRSRRPAVPPRTPGGSVDGPRGPSPGPWPARRPAPAGCPAVARSGAAAGRTGAPSSAMSSSRWKGGPPARVS